MQLTFKHIVGAIRFRDVLAVIVIGVLVFLLYTGKIDETTFSAVLGAIIGYYWGKSTSSTTEEVRT